MVRALIDVYRHEGKLPDCRMSLCKGFTQGGSNADNLLADSYLKGLRDGIDWNTGFEAVVSDAEGESNHETNLYAFVNRAVQTSLLYGLSRVVADFIAGKPSAIYRQTTLIRTAWAYLLDPSLELLSIRITTFVSQKWPKQ